jgi:GLPGLI family protein
MKQILILACLALHISLIAQAPGKIVFEEKVNFHMTLTPEREHLKNMIPEFSSSFWELTYNGDESVYQRQKEEELEFTSTQGNQHMQMRMGRDNRIVYKNLATAKMIDSRDFMQKQFLITGSPTERKWKVGTGQKEILGHNCFEASFQQDSVTKIKAWFAPSLQPANGPSDYQGLPGMILQLDVNEGQRTITATEIITDSVDTSIIIAPSKGKEVTDAEFNKIRDEKMKEMGMQGGGTMMGGQQIMIHRQ